MATRSQARKAEADARRAEAEAQSRVAEAEAKGRAAEAEARAAEARSRAETERARADSERKRIEAATAEATARREAEAKRRADDERRAADAMPWQIGSTLAAVPAGIAAGVGLSKIIEKRHMATVAARNAELAKLANDARRLVARVPDAGKVGRSLTVQIKGTVAAAGHLNLGRLKGPLGLTPAALLLAEAAVTRFGLAPQISDERARAGVGAFATASVFAATNLVGERLIQNATPKLLPAARDLAAIESLRALNAGKAAAKAAAPAANSVGAMVARFAPKIAPVAGKMISKALPVAAVAMALYEGVKGYQKEGATGAAIGVADSLTFGLVSAGRAYLNAEAEKRANASPQGGSAAPHGGGSEPRKAASETGSTSGDVYVPGYTKSDGTRVEGYYRKRD